MSSIDPISLQVIQASEWVAIATTGREGPHLAATWGEYIRTMGVQDDTILIPAGHLNQTEENLHHDPRIELLFATRAIAGTYGPGRGCCLAGRGEVVTSGPHAEAAKAKFPWARGALVVTVEKVSLQL